MPILSLDTLPWILLAIVVARSVVLAARLTVMREQVQQLHERLRAATSAPVTTPRECTTPHDAKRDELEDAVRVALEVVRREAPQASDSFTKVS